MHRQGNEVFPFIYYKRNNMNSSESDENVKNDIGNCKTPLLIAIAERQNINLIQKFISEKEIKKVDGGLNNCLHIAVSVVPYHIDLIEELILSDAEVNAQNYQGDTPLHIASQNPQCDINLVKLLIDNDANINIKNNVLETPLFSFIRRCNEIEKCEEYFKIIQLLLKKEAELNIQNNINIFPVQIAASLPSFINLKLVQEFSNHRADLFVRSCTGDTLLHKIVRDTNDVKFVEFLIEEHPLYVVSENNEGHTPLHTAVYNSCSVDIIRELVNNGANPYDADNNGNQPIHMVHSAPFSTISYLIKRAVHIDCTNSFGRTPLMESIIAARQSEESIRALIYFGASVNHTDKDGYSILHYTLNNTKIKPAIVQLLLEKGANPFNTKFGLTPPIYFCSHNVETAKIYIQYVLLHVIGNRMEIRKPCIELMDFDYHDNEMNETLSEFRDNCVDELLLMKRDQLSEEVLLYDFVYSQCSFLASDDASSVSFEREILGRLASERYRHCQFLLRGSLKEEKLEEYLSTYLYTLKIYAKLSNDAKQNSANPEPWNPVQISGKSVVLNYASISHIFTFLDRESKINFAFLLYKLQSPV